MINIQNIDGYGIQDPGFDLLRQVAQKYCPEELQQVRQEVIPDEALNLSSLTTLLQTFAGTDLPPTSSGESLTTPLPHWEGQGGGSALGVQPFGERELSSLHYEEADTLNSEEIKKDFPVLHQKVNGHHHAEADSGHRQDQRLL